MGGSGADRLLSGGGIDLLSAGTSTQDDDITALIALRIVAQAGTAALGSISGVADDGVVDTLNCGGGTDFLHARNLVAGGDLLLDYAIDP